MHLPIVRFSTVLWLCLLSVLIFLGFSGLPASAEQSPAVWTIQGQINITPPGGTVSIPAGIYTESLSINKTITLTGVSSTTTVIQAVPGQRVITVTAGYDLHLNNLALTGGTPTGSDTAGGAILLKGGSLQATSVRIASNAGSYGGGIFQEGASGRVDISTSRLENNSTQNPGGAIFARGSVFLTDTEVLSNTAGWHGGGLHSDGAFTSLSGGLFSNNRANGDNGGAVNVNNGISITGTRFISNTAYQKGGAVLQWNAGFPVTVNGATFQQNQAWYTGAETTMAAEGGALRASGNVTITGSSFISNAVSTSITQTFAAGGALAIKQGSFSMDSSTVSGNTVSCPPGGFATGGGVDIDSSHAASILHTLFERNNAWAGGGVASGSPNLLVSDSTFQWNSGGYGGALDASQADIRASTFANNSVLNNGGALSSGGPITIADYAGQSARLGWSYYLKFLALISISLGVLNLLPIPILDGGHLLYYMAEIIKGGPLSERVMEIGQKIGLSLLVILMAFAFYNDINRLVSG